MAVSPPVPAPARAVVSRRAKPVKAKWTRIFLAELAATSNVSTAAKKAEVDTWAVYELRCKGARFNREWQVALYEGYDLLELDLLQRLRTGDILPAKDAIKGVRAFDNATALRLLTAHREAVARRRATREDADAKAILASLDAKLERMSGDAAAGDELDGDDQ